MRGVCLARDVVVQLLADALPAVAALPQARLDALRKVCVMQSAGDVRKYTPDD